MLFSIYEEQSRESMNKNKQFCSFININRVNLIVYSKSNPIITYYYKYIYSVGLLFTWQLAILMSSAISLIIYSFWRLAFPLIYALDRPVESIQ